MHEWVCGYCIQPHAEQDAIAIDDLAIAHLMHVVNLLQWKWKVHAIAPEKKINEATYLQALVTWVASGMLPRVVRRGGEARISDHFEAMSIEPGGLDPLGAAQATAMHILREPDAAAPAARGHALELIRGVGDNPYCRWLVEEQRVPLLTRPVREWKDYAPDLRKIFRAELRPDPGDSAAFRFIECTAFVITGEEPTFGAVRSELMRERWKKR
jgi:hypothetical protein